MASSPKEITVDVVPNIQPAPQSVEQNARAWAAQQAADTMRARVMGNGAQFGVSAYEVMTLADWIATGNVPDLGEIEDAEPEGETSMAEPTPAPDRSDEREDATRGPGLGGTDWPGATVVKVTPHGYRQAVSQLVHDFEYGGTNDTARTQQAGRFLAKLGIRVEAAK